jgi:prepilin-type N-terminal cleavage/methylation domain-containing protein
MNPTFPLSHFPTRLVSKTGYTLLELLVVVVVMALSAAVMAPVVLDESDQELTVHTIKNMEVIRTALLGTPSDRVRGNIRFAGYVRDMGNLPDLYDVLATPADPSDDQPAGLWTEDPAGTPDNETDDLASRRSYVSEEKDIRAILRMGWQGPYIRPPTGPALVDGWKNPLRFKRTGDDLVVTSLGADGKEGGDGHYRDITWTLRQNEWTGSVAGYISPLIIAEHADENGQVEVSLYYAPDLASCNPVEVSVNNQVESIFVYPVQSCCSVRKTMCDLDGFFRFNDVPVGTQRFLLAGGIGHEIGVEPGTVWLGTPGILQ